ncbi:hypothetical protein ET445_15585 [Agromyces protaetiae]|uniref:Uncharacterized protein n=1 Tax=Agromyces protaetiae TaxID=2509455 RepID=A0A4P6FIY6_9MICO|nr:hypothetical protein [Agromyces protaetiae]QAY74539.1 hypothetical protein ET445_15585 [Agromyces protaetiae]
MRWDRLFDDLAVQLDLEQQAEERALALEEERLRLAKLTVGDRLRAIASAASAGVDPVLRVRLRGAGIVDVRPAGFGRDWMTAELAGDADLARLAGRASTRHCIVPFAAIIALMPGREQLAASLEPQPESSAALADRLTLPFVLRDLSRRRSPVTITTDDGELHGTLDRVARDHVDLALHELGAPRRESELQGYRIVPLDAVRLIVFE